MINDINNNKKPSAVPSNPPVPPKKPTIENLVESFNENAPNAVQNLQQALTDNGYPGYTILNHVPPQPYPNSYYKHLSNKIVAGTSGPDTMSSEYSQNNIFLGQGGDDTLGFYGNDNTYVNAGSGNDKINFTGSGHGSVLFGDAGNDTISMSGGYNNVAYGGVGNDTITASGNNSKVDGGTGHDTINITGGSNNEFLGGIGNDTFNINSLSSGLISGGVGKDTVTFPQSYLTSKNKVDFSKFSIDSQGNIIVSGTDNAGGTIKIDKTIEVFSFITGYKPDGQPKFLNLKYNELKAKIKAKIKP